MSDLRAYSFEARLVPWGPYVPPRAKVSRTIAMREDQTFAHAGKAGRSAELPLAEAGLEAGGKVAYVFDFGDEWRVLLTVTAVEPADDGGYPRILPGKGDPPPQYPPDED